VFGVVVDQQPAVAARRQACGSEDSSAEAAIAASADCWILPVVLL